MINKIMRYPKISILMTIFNHQKFLKFSLNSVIKQNYFNWELIAIDNGSTDKSRSELKKFKDKRIKKIYLNKNIGRTRCLNFGLKFCKGKYIAILDSDDISLLNRLTKQVKFLENNKDIYLIGSNYQVIDENNRILKKKYFEHNINLKMRNLLFENFIAHSTVMYRKELLKKVGEYPREFRYAQDYAFYLKVYKRFKIFILQDVLVKMRKDHRYTEYARLANSKTIVQEEYKQLKWTLKNYEFSLSEKIFLYLKYIKIVIKKII